LRIRHDATFVSAVLFSIALLAVAPSSLSAALTFRHGTHSTDLLNVSELGIISLAMIAIGLINIWAGYLQKVRWTWFVLLSLVCGWAFPVMLLPFALYLNPNLTLTELISAAFEEPGTPRIFVKSVLIFSVMIVALILPIKSFFWRPRNDRHS
jgi:hypothetical protein